MNLQVQEAKQALELMHKWETIDVCDALELLSPVFESEEVVSLIKIKVNIFILYPSNHHHYSLVLPHLMNKAFKAHSASKRGLKCKGKKFFFYVLMFVLF